MSDDEKTTEKNGDTKTITEPEADKKPTTESSQKSPKADAKENNVDNDKDVGGENDETINGINAGGDADGGFMGSKGNEEKKIFVGGISSETTNVDLQNYFSRFGEVAKVEVKIDRITGRSRGFAFVEFANADACRKSLKDRKQQVKGKTVEIKPAKSRENKKVFIGGLPGDYPEESLREHFEAFGIVEDIEWPYDKQRGVRRNFAFVVFEDEDAANKASAENKQKFGERECDVKKAVPQNRRFPMGGPMGMGGPGMNPRGGGAYGGGRGGRQGGYGPYGGYGHPGGVYGGGSGYGNTWGGNQYGSSGGWGDWYGQGYNYGAAPNLYGNTADNYGYNEYSGGYQHDYWGNTATGAQQMGAATGSNQWRSGNTARTGGTAGQSGGYDAYSQSLGSHQQVGLTNSSSGGTGGQSRSSHQRGGFHHGQQHHGY